MSRLKWVAILFKSQLQNSTLSLSQLQDANLERTQLQGANLLFTQLQNANLKYANLQGADLSSAQLQGTNLEGANLQGAYLEQVKYGNYINPKTKQSTSTKFPKSDIYCLTDDKKLPICKKYNPVDTKNIKKITSYWINNLACSDKLIAQNIISNHLFDFFENDKFRVYLIPLLKKKLTDKDCIGIQNLSDEFKQQIKDAIK